MELKLTFTILFVISLIVSILAALSLLHFLRKLTKEWALSQAEGKTTNSQRKHWYRYIVPAALAFFFAAWHGIEAGNLRQLFHFVILGVGLPMACAFYFLRDALEGKTERLAALFALLVLVNASFFTTHWYNHYRDAHGDGYDDGVNPHLSTRNWVLWPLWGVTVLSALWASYLWRQADRRGNESLALPTTAKEIEQETAESYKVLCS